MSGSTKKTVIIALILTLASVAVFGFMVFRVFEQGDRLVAQIGALEEQRAQEAAHRNLQRIATDSQADRDKIKEYFLEKESESIDFLNQVETLAPQVGVALKTTNLQLVTEKNTKQAWIEVTFEFSGTRMYVQNFIQILETLPYVLRLNSVTMEARSRSEWQASVTMQIQVLSYDAQK
ncbi:hypothetical protein KC902_03380 [Candidatus Kaiserbacteria bacterium]|nr:hypothetical protein [Candidatus Kaiserbacteria bacterium]USN89094.1 MAG: hypothetical protein H6780_01585 [Candidatus Nomurabacteria bacterium]